MRGPEVKGVFHYFERKRPTGVDARDENEALTSQLTLDQGFLGGKNLFKKKFFFLDE